MSKQKNNSANSKLEELLNAAKADKGSLDDFEKEALEGFALLNSDKEVMQAKSELDKKIYPLFSQRKRAGAVYWFAAAGLMLVVGFSVYFIYSGNATKPTQMAVNQPVSKASEPVTAPRPADVPPEEKPVEQPAKQIANKTAGGGQYQQSKKEKETYAYNKKPEEYKKADSENKAMMQDAGTGSNGNDDVVTAAPIAEATPQTAGKNEVAFNQDAEGDKDIVTSKNMTVNKYSSSNIQPSVNGAATTAMHAKSYQAAPPAAIEVASVEKRSKAKTKKEKAADTEINCSYTGGAEAFAKDLKPLLVAQNVDRELTGILHVTSERKVEKVIITNPESFSKKELKKITETLKTLEKFTLPLTANDGQLYEYAFSYKP